MNTTTMTRTHPWFYVPILYFLMGVPYVIVNNVSLVMFKKMGVPNGELALWTSLISWPWMLKMLWGPMIDHLGTKRNWILYCQFAIIAVLAIVAKSVSLESSWMFTLGLLGIVAFLSASHDVAADGFYLLALKEQDQSYFVGIRSTAFRLAMIFGSGFLIYLAGVYETQNLALAQVWSKVLMTGLGIYAIGVVFGLFSLPKPSTDHPVKKEAFGYKIFQEYFTQSKIIPTLGFILFYRFGESMVSKMSALFLIDAVEKGGMGLSTQDVGFVGGVVGVAALTAGGILGGITLSKWGLKKCLWPMVLSMNVPNLLYYLASVVGPSKFFIFSVVAVDQFGYGFGFSAYMVYLMFIAQDTESQTAHFAISTGLMAFGAMFAGSVSGYLQEWLGYSGFFLATVACSIPGMFILKFIPLEKKDLFKVDVDIT